MGTLKTKKSKELRNLKRAHHMAEVFAVSRTKHFLNRFLVESGLADAMYATYLDVQASWTKILESKKLELEAANVSGNDILKQSLQSEIEDRQANIDEPVQKPEEYMESLHDDLNLHFGGALALAYAMGYADSANGATAQSMTATGKIFDTPVPEAARTDVPKIRIADEAPSPLLEQPPQEFVDLIDKQPRIITDPLQIK